MAAEQDNHGQRYQVFKQTLAESEKKELVEALGFDPANISIEKLKHVYSLANVIYDDSLTRIILAQFVKDYADAQHCLEWSEFSGGAVFEIILTALLAVATGGVGAIASLGSQARKMSQLKKLGALLNELAEKLKGIPKDKAFRLPRLKEDEDRKAKKPKKPAADDHTAKEEKIDGTKGADNFSVRKEDIGQDKKSNPLEDPKVAKQIKEDSSAIYGYSPKAGKGLDKFGIDFSDPQQVGSAREKRIEYLENLEKKKAALAEEVSALQKNGMSLEDIARMKVEQRNQNRIDSYLQTENLDGLKSMQERNLIEYGRKEGPTADQLFEKKGSWENVIFGSVKSSKAMDVLLGLD